MLGMNAAFLIGGVGLMLHDANIKAPPVTRYDRFVASWMAGSVCGGLIGAALRTALIHGAGWPG